MADLTVTAAQVRPLQGAVVRRFTAGGTINVGSPVYLSAAGKVAAADGSAVATACAIGVLAAVADGASYTAAASGDTVDVVLSGPVGGYTCTYGTKYYVDDDAGVMADTAGTKSTIVGVGLDANTLLVNIIYVGLA